MRCIQGARIGRRRGAWLARAAANRSSCGTTGEPAATQLCRILAREEDRRRGAGQHGRASYRRARLAPRSNCSRATMSNRSRCPPQSRFRRKNSSRSWASISLHRWSWPKSPARDDQLYVQLTGQPRLGLGIRPTSRSFSSARSKPSSTLSATTPAGYRHGHPPKRTGHPAPRKDPAEKESVVVQALGRRQESVTLRRRAKKTPAGRVPPRMYSSTQLHFARSWVLAATAADRRAVERHVAAAAALRHLLRQSQQA